MPSVSVLMDGSGVGTDVGVIGFCAVILIEGEQRVLFDSAHVGRRTYLLAQLEARALSPEDIDVQVLSHAHWDHVQNCDLFEAPLLVHRDELRYAHLPHRNDWATPRWTGAVLDTMKSLEVGEGHEIMPGCRVIDLPGHSPGSIGLEVETESGLCILTGDAIHNARVAQRGQSPLVFWDAGQADVSIKRVVESGALILPGARPAVPPPRRRDRVRQRAPHDDRERRAGGARLLLRPQPATTRAVDHARHRGATAGVAARARREAGGRPGDAPGFRRASGAVLSTPTAPTASRAPSPAPRPPSRRRWRWRSPPAACAAVRPG